MSGVAALAMLKKILKVRFRAPIAFSDSVL
jgi:hypothetical protein